VTRISERARLAQGRLPSGRHALSRKFIINSQRERIVDATAATVAAKGLAGLTIPEIARRANVSHQTFYEIYDTKHDAFLGALKVGMHQALLVAAEAYEAHADDWPRALAAGLRALIDYLVSEPAHAHLSLVDTFAASPDAIEVRDSALHSFSAYLGPGYALAGSDRDVPAIAAEAITGGVWQILHDYVDNGRVSELPDVAPQVIYLALVPFIGSQAALGALS
jgi:AcrR family transcriptional regulator